MTHPLLCGPLADFILTVHVLFIAFVVGGLALILVGTALRWRWVRNLWFRLGHLAAIVTVATEAWCGRSCPLTIWENELREAAGQAAYGGGFIHHWLQRLIFFDLPQWVFTVAYTAFGLLVLLTWILAPPRWPWREDRCRGNPDPRTSPSPSGRGCD